MQKNFKYDSKNTRHSKQKELHSRIGRRSFGYVDETTPKMSRHHVPPKVPDKELRVIHVQEKHHRYYHALFGNPSHFEDACRILWRDWWCKDGTPMPTVRGRDLF